MLKKQVVLYIVILLKTTAYCQYGYIRYIDTTFLIQDKVRKQNNYVEYNLYRAELEHSKLSIVSHGDTLKIVQVRHNNILIFDWIEYLNLKKKDTIKWSNNKIKEIYDFKTSLIVDTICHHTLGDTLPNVIWFIIRKTRNGKYSSYYENGQLSSKGKYCEGKFGVELKDSLWCNWYPNGVLMKMESYKVIPREIVKIYHKDTILIKKIPKYISVLTYPPY